MYYNEFLEALARASDIISGAIYLEKYVYNLLI